MPEPWILILLAAVLAAGFYLGARALLEPQRPEFNRYSLPPEAEGDGGTPLRILFFSDYHHPLNHLPLEALYAYISKSSPDAVVFGGDMASSAKDTAEGQQLAERLAAYCREDAIPYIAVRGNHDDALEEASGYPLLRNQHYILRAADERPWLLIGLEDIRLGRPDFDGALNSAHPASPLDIPARDIPPSRRIVLAHNPDTVLTLPENEARFCLSGHFHGGQIKLPGKLEYMMLRSEVMCRCGLTDGVLPVRGFWHFISRGWGRSSSLFVFL